MPDCSNICIVKDREVAQSFSLWFSVYLCFPCETWSRARLQITAPRTEYSLFQVSPVHWACAGLCKNESGRELVLQCISPGTILTGSEGELRWDPEPHAPTSPFARWSVRGVRRWGVQPEDSQWDHDSDWIPPWNPHPFLWPLRCTTPWAGNVLLLSAAPSHLFARWILSLL